MDKKEKRTWILTLGLFLLFGGMFLAARKAGGAAVILQKAAAICLECIGIG